TGVPVAATRLRPLTVTAVGLPATTLGGEKPSMRGWTLNAPTVLAVPAGFVTETTPVRAPIGTTTFSDVAVTAVGVTVTGPVNVTAVAPAMFRPLIATTLPTGAATGATVVGLGGRITTRSAGLVATPSSVVTLSLPVVALGGTRS